MDHRIQPQIRTLPLADIELPKELEKLYELAYNLWWVWTPRALDLFSMTTRFNC